MGTFQLCKYIFTVDWRVRPLVLIVKLWAQCHNINNAKEMTISSYSLVLMVIHFLQCMYIAIVFISSYLIYYSTLKYKCHFTGGVSPPVLPCLQSMFAGKFGPHTDIHNIDIHEELNIPSSCRLPENRQSLGELLVEFFRYYVMFE